MLKPYVPKIKLKTAALTPAFELLLNLTWTSGHIRPKVCSSSKEEVPNTGRGPLFNRKLSIYWLNSGLSVTTVKKKETNLWLETKLSTISYYLKGSMCTASINTNW